MIDKQQLQAMGEHQAEYGFLCFTKQIEDLQARLQECAKGAAKMQEQRDYAYKMMGKFGGERDELARQLEAEKMKSAAMYELLKQRLGDAATLTTCARCDGHGVIGGVTGQTPESMDFWEAICPECDGRGNIHVAAEGWQLVPVEPNIQMLAAFVEAGGKAISGYKAMLAAAPRPEQTK